MRNNYIFRIIILLGIQFILFSCKGDINKQQKEDLPMEMQEAAILDHHRLMGDSLVMVAQQELLRNVSEAMVEGGASNAVEFCNIHAPGIVSRMADSLNCTLRRTSTLYRNPEHKPTTAEQNILDWYASLGEGELTSTVWREDGKVHYASPIKVSMQACLQCHGKPGEDINAQVLSVIEENYPEDLATGYSMGELRGMWHLTFEPKGVK